MRVYTGILNKKFNWLIYLLRTLSKACDQLENYREHHIQQTIQNSRKNQLSEWCRATMKGKYKLTPQNSNKKI